MGTQPPPPKWGGARLPNFWPISIAAKWLDASRCQGDFVLDGDPVPSPKGGGAPQIFFGHVYCGQTAEWIKMPLGMVVGLSPGEFVLDGDLASAPKRGRAPSFGPRLLWPNGCMDQDATWYGGRPWPTRRDILDGDPAALP